MFNQDIIDIFNDCVTRLERGESLEDCLAWYPQYADELEPMLEATQIPIYAQAPLDEVTVSQQRVQTQFEQALLQSHVQPTRSSFPLSRVASILFTILFIGSLLTSGVVIVAQESIPGDSLYAVKRLTEQVQLLIAQDDEILRQEFAQRRIEETKQVIAIGREISVQFEGVIHQVDERSLEIEGLNIEVLPPLTTVNLSIGMQVEVIAQTQSNRKIIAKNILIDSILSIDELTPTLTSTVMPSLTSTASPISEIVETSQVDTPQPNVITTIRPEGTATMRPTELTIRETPTLTPNITTPSGNADCDVSPPDDWIPYAVQAGDTPSGIAVGTDLTFEELYRMNCNLNPRLIVVGEIIYVPYTPRLAITATLTPTSERPEIEATAVPVERSVTTPQIRPTATTASREQGNQNQRQRDNNQEDDSDEIENQQRGR